MQKKASHLYRTFLNGNVPADSIRIRNLLIKKPLHEKPFILTYTKYLGQIKRHSQAAGKIHTGMNKMKKLIPAFLIIMFYTSAFASYDRALELYKNGFYKDSLKEIAAELDIKKDMDPDFPNYRLRFLAAHNHWKLGNLEYASIHFKKCIDMNQSVDPYIDLALMYLDKGKLADADSYAQKGLKKEKNPMFYYILGETSLKRRNDWRAKEMFEAANALDQDNYACYNGLGIALMNLKKYGDADTAFSTALSLAPDSPEVLNNMAVCLEKQGKNKEALEVITKAALTAPEDKATAANLNRIKGKAR